MEPRTRRRWAYVAVTVLPLVVLASCFGGRAIGWASGRSDAAAALEEGRAELCAIGLPCYSHGGFDPATGLFYSRNLGCLVSDHEIGYRDGWNGVVRAAVERGDLDRVSLRHKARSEERVRAAFAADPGVELSPGRPLRDASGRFEIAICDSRVVVPTSGPDRPSDLWVSDGVVPRVLFADGGTTALVRCEDATWDRVATLDLPSGRLLQEWSQRRGDAPACPRPPR